MSGRDRVCSGERVRETLLDVVLPTGKKKRSAATVAALGFSISTSVTKSIPPAPTTCPATDSVTERVAGLTVNGFVTELEPLTLVALSVTLYEPGVEYVCVGF